MGGPGSRQERVTAFPAGPRPSGRPTWNSPLGGGNWSRVFGYEDLSGQIADRRPLGFGLREFARWGTDPGSFAVVISRCRSAVHGSMGVLVEPAGRSLQVPDSGGPAPWPEPRVDHEADPYAAAVGAEVRRDSKGAEFTHPTLFLELG